MQTVAEKEVDFRTNLLPVLTVLPPAVSDQARQSIKQGSDTVLLFRTLHVPHTLFISGR
jgi:hypothetical protein